MSQRMKNRLAFVTGGSIPIAIIAILVIVMWLRDVHNDRKHILVVNDATPVFVGNGDAGCSHQEQLTIAKRGAKLPVRRIRYQKDCATVDVLLPDGRKGYVVLGLGDVSLNPPLPNI